MFIGSPTTSSVTPCPAASPASSSRSARRLVRRTVVTACPVIPSSSETATPTVFVPTSRPIARTPSLYPLPRTVHPAWGTPAGQPGAQPADLPASRRGIAAANGPAHPGGRHMALDSAGIAGTGISLQQLEGHVAGLGKLASSAAGAVSPAALAVDTIGNALHLPDPIKQIAKIALGIGGCDIAGIIS